MAAPGNLAPSGVASAGAGDTGGSAGPVRAVRVERDGAEMRVFYSNKVRESIGAGRYVMDDATGKTVIDRAATPADLDRVRENVQRSGLAATAGASLPAELEVELLEVTEGGLSVRYREGWSESLAEGRYRMADPDGNTVVERPATAEDRNRLQGIAGG